MLGQVVCRDGLGAVSILREVGFWLEGHTMAAHRTGAHLQLPLCALIFTKTKGYPTTWLTSVYLYHLLESSKHVHALKFTHTLKEMS